MAVTVLDTVNNQWFVQRKDGELELCHNAATAQVLCRQYNEEEQKEQRKLKQFIDRYIEIQKGSTQVQLQEVCI